MGKCLEFALAMTVILVINSFFAIWIGSVVADRVEELLIGMLKILAIAN